MLKLLLDENISPKIAQSLKAMEEKISVESLHYWLNGKLINQTDARILQEAHKPGLTLVTFDLATIPPLLAEMTEMAEPHSGVIFISSKTFPQNNYGSLTRALFKLWQDKKHLSWKNRIEFLSKS